jgi:hypothetical protein
MRIAIIINMVAPYTRYLQPSAGPAEWARAMEEMLLASPAPADHQIRALRERYYPAATAAGVRVGLCE